MNGGSRSGHDAQVNRRNDFFFNMIYIIGRGKRNITLKMKVGIGFGKNG